MIDKLVAVGEFIFIIPDPSETERNGLLIPEASVKKPNTGKILSVGVSVVDLNVKKGRIAIFNKQVGNNIEMFGTEITVLNGNNQVLGVTDATD